MTRDEFYLKYWLVAGSLPQIRDVDRYYMKDMMDAAEHAKKNGLVMRLVKFRGRKEHIVFIKP